MNPDLYGLKRMESLLPYFQICYLFESSSELEILVYFSSGPNFDTLIKGIPLKI